MHNDRVTRYTEMIVRIDADIEKLQSALNILNHVWVENPDPQNAIVQAVTLIGGEIALLQRKRVEAEYFRDNPPLPPPPPPS